MKSMLIEPRLTPPLKWHGGKNFLARRIIELMPPHMTYVEPFFGGGAVLLAKNPEGVSEVVNDLNPWLSNFWRVLRTPALFEQFRRWIEATPFSERMWNAAVAKMEAKPNVRQHAVVTAALVYFVLCRQSLAGRMDTFAPISTTRVRRGMNEQASAWLNTVEGLPTVHERLKRVAILNRPAIEIIRQMDGPETLGYLDPPYPHETRSSPDVYQFEMSTKDHIELLDTIKACKGKIMISSYPNELYNRALGDWTRHSFDLPNNAAGGTTKARENEILWCNF